MKKREFKVGDTVRYRKQFLRSTSWYTNVPRNGTVTSLRSLPGIGQLCEVDWCEYDPPGTVGSFNLELARRSC